MAFESRCPEGQAVESEVLGVFSKVAAWTGRFAAWRVSRLLRGSLGPGKMAVDIGTGPGTIPLHLARLHPGSRILGLDISLEMLEKAAIHREKMGMAMPLTAADGECLPFRDNSMDAVISLFSLHHMDHPGLFFREANRIIKPEGALLIIDFRRDMPTGLFPLLNTFWKAVFFFSAGKHGFHDSVRSAWRPEELENILSENEISHFTVKSNAMELFVVSGQLLES
jgi:ubiquinone/menaquinone biosynthesis C-methylase UbiE